MIHRIALGLLTSDANIFLHRYNLPEYKRVPDFIWRLVIARDKNHSPRSDSKEEKKLSQCMKICLEFRTRYILDVVH